MTLDWARGPAPGADELDQLVYLSRLIGREPRLVQPGGGNTSIKLGEALLVKGSGTDLRTVGREGFARLSLPRLAALRDVAMMSDVDMMRFMASCALQSDGPAPSVETPLHSLLPHRVIAHTHDVATMSLTNVSDGMAERLVADLFQGEVVYVPYARPGFPLARMVNGMVNGISARAIGLALAHHGLVVWGADPAECCARLERVVHRIEHYLERSRRGRAVLGATPHSIATAEVRRRCAELVLPIVRGALGPPAGGRVILHFDDADDLVTALGAERLPSLVGRGVATPEHILRAGRLPLWLDLDPSAPPDRIADAVRTQIARQRAEYEEYHRRYAAPGERPLDDWAKVVLAPGLGMITAFRDKRGAVTANQCYRAVLETITNAEAIDAFQFIPEPEVFAFEHWPLERRKTDEQDARERASLLVPRHVAVVIGAGSGIGRAAVRRFAEEGAHVVVADLDQAAAETVATEVEAAYPGRAVAVELGGDRIRVNAINADQVETPLFRRFVEERAASGGVSVEQQLEAYRRRTVMGVSLIPAEAVADLAVLLASERFRFTTGDILTVDGGLPEAFPR